MKMSLWRNKDYLVRQYVVLEKSMKTISQELGIGETCVHKWIHRFNIPVRTRSESMSGIEKSEEHKAKLSMWAKKRIGKLNANWKNGKTKEALRVRYRGYRERKRIVLERDNYECQECGLDIDLHIHHIKQIKDFPELANDITNCITLCKYCHRKLHFSKENSANSAKARTVNAELNSDNPNIVIGMSDKCVETIYGAVSNN